MDERGAPEEARLVLRQLELLRRRDCEVRDRSRVAQCVRRLEVDEVRDRAQGPIEVVSHERHTQRRLGVDHGAPGVRGVEPDENPFRVGAQGGRQRRVELQAGTLLGQLERRVVAAQPVRDLDELRELRQARCERDRIAGQTFWPPLPVPLLVRRTDCFLHGLRQAQPLGQGHRHGRVPGNHPVEVCDGRRSRNSTPTRKRCKGGLPLPIRLSAATAARRLR